tara:strand:+ start:685 stop:822 length:138 start_codon:yes stop_codon:yes gene_type:complete
MEKDIKKKLTTKERIEGLKVQLEQTKETFLKISGAIEILELIEKE